MEKHKIIPEPYIENENAQIETYRNLRAFVNTKIEESAMAPAASIGESKTSNIGYSAPAATGIKMML